MNFTFHSAYQVYFGGGCVRGQADAWALYKHAYIVTGAHSGRLSGALADVEAALSERHIPYTLFEGIENNPSLEQCRALGLEARASGADFIVAIGGGSPIDAAKAIAVFACEDVDTATLFRNAYKAVLPIIAIPTTSGTGSEVTPYSVLTCRDIATKRSFGDKRTFPRVALLDPLYTQSLSKTVTLDTAMDAFTHCLESVLSLKATPLSDAYNLEGLRRFKPCMEAIEAGSYGAMRDELMLVSMLGGMGITYTGTTLMHGMGYMLTYHKGLTHGAANCAVMPGYLRYAEKKRPERLQLALQTLGMTADALTAFVGRNFSFGFTVTPGEIEQYAKSTIAQQGSSKNIDPAVTVEDVVAIYRDALFN